VFFAQDSCKNVFIIGCVVLVCKATFQDNKAWNLFLPVFFGEKNSKKCTNFLPKRHCSTKICSMFFSKIQKELGYGSFVPTENSLQALAGREILWITDKKTNFHMDMSRNESLF
jgi:hypothetical protein